MRKEEHIFNYVVDQFADLQVLRYRVAGFDSLTLQQKKLVYYLSEAALQGRDILFDQNGRYNLRIRRTLEAIEQGYTGDRNSEDFKKTIVSLYQSGKTYSEIQKEYGVSSSALSKWVHKYSQVQVDDDTVLTAQQIKALQRRNAQLEEENLILKKAIAIFTPHSDND